MIKLSLRKVLPYVFTGFMLLLLIAPDAHSGNMTPELQTALQALGVDQEIPIIVTFSDRVNPGFFTDSNKRLKRSKIIRALKEKSDSIQRPLKSFLLDKKVIGLTSLWINNAIAVTVPADIVSTIVNFPGVRSVTLDYSIQAPVKTYGTISPPEWNLVTIKAPDLWNLGFTGTGVVVANMDTGVDINHPDLLSRWRGGTNSWYDPNGEHAAPYDVNGHGTQTMGIMVGGNAGGTSIGVAPGAEWIAVKIYNDAGVTTLSVIHQGFQWLLDPDNDVNTDDAPDIVNNSWGLDAVNICSNEFQSDIQTLKASGIEVIFSAGNSGPNPSTSISPANNSGSFSAGASDETNSIASFSSRGPSACDGNIFPNVTAPGVNVRTSDITYGGVFPDSYSYVSGTSFSGPHVAGTMALLLSAFPNLQIQDIDIALKTSALDLGITGPDNDFGYGLIDGMSAYNYLASVSDFPPAAVNDSYTITEDTGMSIAAPGLLANDKDPTNYPLSAVLVAGPANGTVTLNSDGSFMYGPNPNFNGTDYFTYKAYNGDLYSNSAIVSITVTPVKDQPIAIDDSASTLMTTAVTINVYANDYDVDHLTRPRDVVIVTKPKHGKVFNNKNGTVTYRPKQTLRGIDSFTYKLKVSKNIASNIATVTVTVD